MYDFYTKLAFNELLNSKHVFESIFNTFYETVSLHFYEKQETLNINGIHAS